MTEDGSSYYSLVPEFMERSNRPSSMDISGGVGFLFYFRVPNAQGARKYQTLI